ncbi:hypothetical protein QYM36_016871 [Artemia franciscana]|uniref:Ig-like domain-containing protein n=1 Tax=Artemia franciscana TaxID=6661 RepID=A0AA88KWA5_ARTSF|nr:hypothetical protein QYM36_016871 [Artemia franciscana]
MRKIVRKCLLCAESYTVSVQRVTAGETLRLECQIRGSMEDSEEEEKAEENIGSNFPLIWIKYDIEDPENHLLISHGETLLVEDSRYSLKVIRDEGIAVLNIEEALMSDSGMYQCQMPIDGGTGPTSPIEVIIEEKSKNSFYKSGSPISFRNISVLLFGFFLFL